MTDAKLFQDSVSVQFTNFEQQAPPLQAFLRIHLQKPSGRSANSSQADDNGTIQPEVLGPDVAARMKEAHDLISVGIGTEKICPFVQIALVTGQSKILGI